jgi:two-component system sensor histidine kinase RegB
MTATMTLAPSEPTVRLDKAGTSPRQGVGAPGERLRLRTLVTLRWGAMAGQMLALLIVRFLLGFDLPLLGCVGLIILSALFNLALLLAFPPQRVLGQWEAALQLGFDVLQLGGLLYLTGGVGNPFAVLVIVPVILAASSLKGRDTLFLAGLAVATVLVLAAVSQPLPWARGSALVLPGLYRWAAALALSAAAMVTAAYARRAAAESARMELALLAAESVLAREQRMSALGGLAAAAAHELGTPLATIAIVAKEMARESPPGSMREDAELVSAQAQRCRDILRRLAEAPDEGDVVHARVSLPLLLEEAAGSDSDEEVRVEWSVVGPPDTDPPDLIRHPEVGHALTSFIENAMDFAKTEVRLVGRYDYDSIAIEIRDDGPGFAPEIFAKLGEPYVTSRPSGENSPSGHLGMGLGFFIAKTLLERTGAAVDFHNARAGGAVVAIRWPRDEIEAPPE